MLFITDDFISRKTQWISFTGKYNAMWTL